MSRLTVRLPETLHQQLAQVAAAEGISLNQYIVYALTRQTAFPTAQEIERQQASFQALTAKLGRGSSPQIEQVLAEREVVNGESELTAETIERLKAKIQLSQS
jgi:uncharacterized protein (DUF1778 family)